MGQALGPLALLGATDLAVQWSCFVAAAALQTEKFYDISGSCTYVGLVALALARGLSRGLQFSTRQLASAAQVCIWATRLGTFLLRRVLRDGKDSRFDKVKTRPSVFFLYWTLQAVWVFVTALPVWVSLSRGDDGGTPTEGRDWVGRLLWSVGFAFQVLADSQKSAFRADPANQGRFISTGLWGCSQHPNYFGEVCMWFGVWLSCSPALRGLEHVSALSPLFVFYLLRYVSGVPVLRRAAMKKWGSDPDFLAYIRRTPLLLPIPMSLQ